MLGEAPARSATRIAKRAPVWIALVSHDGREHPAFVRDISAHGLYFYSDFNPKPGDEISFVLQFLDWQNGPRIHCRGTIVRLEQADPEAACGIAVRFAA